MPTVKTPAHVKALQNRIRRLRLELLIARNELVFLTRLDMHEKHGLGAMREYAMTACERIDKVLNGRKKR